MPLSFEVEVGRWRWVERREWVGVGSADIVD